MQAINRFLLALTLVGSGAVFAAPPGGGPMHDSKTQSQMMSTQQANQQMMHQVMSPQYTEHMLQLMQKMQNNVTQMSELMEKHRMMNQTNLSQAAKVMERMSSHMRELSQNMQTGKFDDKSVALLNKHDQEMTQMMQQLQQQLESGQQ